MTVITRGRVPLRLWRVTNGSVEVIAVCLDQTVEFCGQPRERLRMNVHTFKQRCYRGRYPFLALSGFGRKQEISEEKLHSTLT